MSTAPDTPGEAPSSEPVAGARSRRSAQSEEMLRDGLMPLAPGERPVALWAAILLSIVVALAVLVGAATVHNLSSRGGSIPGAVLIAGVLAATARGMYGQRYWAVLAFEALLAFQIIVTSLALIVASTLLAAGICVVSVGLGGWLFWKLVRVMSRIQAGER